MNYESIHKIPGFKIGHAEDTAALTGCTVILCDEKTCGGVDQRGGAPGTTANVIVPPLEILTGNQGGTFFEGKKYLIGQLYETMAAGMILTTDPVPQPAYAQ